MLLVALHCYDRAWKWRYAAAEVLQRIRAVVLRTLCADTLAGLPSAQEHSRELCRTLGDFFKYFSVFVVFHSSSISDISHPVQGSQS